MVKTIEDGIHTYDIYKEGISKEKVGTHEFALAVIKNLDEKPQILPQVAYSNNTVLKLPKYQRKPAADKELIGVDVFVHWTGTNPDELAALIQAMYTPEVSLTMITNRGIKVWPQGFEETFCTDHWRCRFKATDGKSLTKHHIIELLIDATIAGIDTIKTENLYTFNGKPAFSLGQGQ